MTRPADAIVTGFTRNAELCARAFAPLLALKQRQILRDIHYVTWDDAGLDAYVAAVPDGVTVARVRQLQPQGNPNQRGIVYQTANLEAALACVTDDALVVKLRPDFVFREAFLESKLGDFERLCAPQAGTAFGVKLARMPFARKLWVPWADANQPFFFEDAAFIGLKDDLRKLVPGGLERHLPLLADMECGSLVHVLRYVGAFLPQFPIFRRYVENYGAFRKDMAYRNALVNMLLQDAFFWHLVVANAWILHAGFHVDCGEAGDLSFYPNTVNAAWDDVAKLKLTPPYDNVAMWRCGAKAGTEATPGLLRTYGRLMDDAWPRAFFTRPMTDMPEGMLARLARGVALYPTGVLAPIEDAFYAKLAAFRRQHAPSSKAA